MKKTRTTIKKSIYKLILFITIFLFLLNVLTTVIVNIITKDYTELMENSIQLSQVTVNLQNSNHTINRIISTNDPDLWDALDNQLLDINRQLDHIRITLEFTSTGRIYFRNIQNMYDNYKFLINQYALVQHENNLVEYGIAQDIKTQFSYINNHCQLLTQEYLQHSSETYAQALATYNKYRSITFIALILFIILLIGFSVLFIRSMNRSLERLCYKAEELSKKNWTIEDIEENRYEELHTLAQAFNNMKHEIITYIDDVKDKAKLQIILKETQLSALQMQINPHFLFNTLNIISRIALFNNVPEIMALIDAISKILRYSLSHAKELVPLSQELDVLNAYIHIQETRFSDTIQFQVNMKEHDDIPVPPMILQPIVENAIEHGLKTKSENGQITITIYQDDQLVIQIADNGIGMQALSTEKKQTTGIGLNNVRQRLQLTFNQDNLLNIQSHQGEGTTVTIKIPLEGGV
ncbi:sensor histidine kinase [Vallitalea okinawensis]|uniref:sensor histidine kinase n=1 Tax=Vallitalea okinawensis TaxID=2078660 RepID=UPI001478590C|nr:histidine kinase [Vallitalea okinawensis]